MTPLKGVRMVTLQFSFSNPNVIPASVKRLDKETKEERVTRKSRSSGVLVISPTEKCSLVEILSGLESSGYVLVDGSCIERIDARDPDNKTYHMARFVFVHRRFANVSPQFEAVRDVIRDELDSICRDAFWRVRAFLNPFYGEGGEEVLDERAVSINLEVRLPLFHPDGTLVKVWWKDEYGERIGSVPFPIRANHHLRVSDGIVRLVATQ